MKLVNKAEVSAALWSMRVRIPSLLQTYFTQKYRCGENGLRNSSEFDLRLKPWKP